MIQISRPALCLPFDWTIGTDTDGANQVLRITQVNQKREWRRISVSNSAMQFRRRCRARFVKSLWAHLQPTRKSRVGPSSRAFKTCFKYASKGVRPASDFRRTFDPRIFETASSKNLRKGISPLRRDCHTWTPPWPWNRSLMCQYCVLKKNSAFFANQGDD